MTTDALFRGTIRAHSGRAREVGDSRTGLRDRSRRLRDLRRPPTRRPLVLHLSVANHLCSPCRGEDRDDATGGDVMTRWTCPGCRLEIEATAIAAGHRCPNRQTRWTDFRPADSATAQVAESETHGDPKPARLPKPRAVANPNRGGTTDG